MFLGVNFTTGTIGLLVQRNLGHFKLFKANGLRADNIKKPDHIGPILIKSLFDLHLSIFALELNKGARSNYVFKTNYAWNFIQCVLLSQSQEDTY